MGGRSGSRSGPRQVGAEERKRQTETEKDDGLEGLCVCQIAVVLLLSLLGEGSTSSCCDNCQLSAGVATTRAEIVRTLGLDAVTVGASEVSRLVSAAILLASSLLLATAAPERAPPPGRTPAAPEQQLPWSYFLNNNGEKDGDESSTVCLSATI